MIRGGLLEEERRNERRYVTDVRMETRPVPPQHLVNTLTSISRLHLSVSNRKTHFPPSMVQRRPRSKVRPSDHVATKKNERTFSGCYSREAPDLRLY